jgi:hypothetical protein
MNHLAELEDEHVIQQIENLLQPAHDFGNDLSSNEKKKIERGLQQAENGDVIDFEAFINNF